MLVLASFLGSPHLEGGEPGTFYHVCDVKGRHDIITWGWTKLGVHACSHTSVSRPLHSSFQVSMALVCYLRLCSQRYIVVHVELINFFLSQWRQLEQQQC